MRSARSVRPRPLLPLLLPLAVASAVVVSRAWVAWEEWEACQAWVRADLTDIGSLLARADASTLFMTLLQVAWAAECLEWEAWEAWVRARVIDIAACLRADARALFVTLQVACRQS